VRQNSGEDGEREEGMGPDESHEGNTHGRSIDREGSPGDGEEDHGLDHGHGHAGKGTILRIKNGRAREEFGRK